MSGNSEKRKYYSDVKYFSNLNDLEDYLVLQETSDEVKYLVIDKRFLLDDITDFVRYETLKKVGRMRNFIICDVSELSSCIVYW